MIPPELLMNILKFSYPVEYQMRIICRRWAASISKYCLSKKYARELVQEMEYLFTTNSPLSSEMKSKWYPYLSQQHTNYKVKYTTVWTIGLRQSLLWMFHSGTNSSTLLLNWKTSIGSLYWTIIFIDRIFLWFFTEYVFSIITLCNWFKGQCLRFLCCCTVKMYNKIISSAVVSNWFSFICHWQKHSTSWTSSHCNLWQKTQLSFVDQPNRQLISH